VGDHRRPRESIRDVSTPEVDTWLSALVARHTANLSPPQFFKAIRALSARYVESRGRLPDRSPIDSAGKRAAFAAFYAPLHFLTTSEIVRALAKAAATLRGIESIIDLGCGTGVAGAAWALECERPLDVRGFDKDSWSLAEAAWNWRQLRVRGETRRADMVATAEHLAGRASGRGLLDRTGVLLAWSVNELPDLPRDTLFRAFTRLAEQQATVLIIEPIARSTTPWWPEWTKALSSAFPHTRTDDWKFDVGLPPALAQMSEAAGFGERTLSARSLLIRRSG
jgi:hypothetical protein